MAILLRSLTPVFPCMLIKTYILLSCIHIFVVKTSRVCLNNLIFTCEEKFQKIPGFLAFLVHKLWLRKTKKLGKSPVSPLGIIYQMSNEDILRLQSPQ